MAEPREFYYPLQDKAADIDRVLHDLVDITDTEESLNMYVKVIEVEGQPHFWFGEGGEKQKPIEVDNREVPVGDGQDWVGPSEWYAQVGISEYHIEDYPQVGYVLRNSVPKSQCKIWAGFKQNDIINYFNQEEYEEYFTSYSRAQYKYSNICPLTTEQINAIKSFVQNPEFFDQFNITHYCGPANFNFTSAYAVSSVKYITFLEEDEILKLQLTSLAVNSKWDSSTGTYIYTLVLTSETFDSKILLEFLSEKNLVLNFDCATKVIGGGSLSDHIDTITTEIEIHREDFYIDETRYFGSEFTQNPYYASQLVFGSDPKGNLGFNNSCNLTLRGKAKIIGDANSWAHFADSSKIELYNNASIIGRGNGSLVVAGNASALIGLQGMSGGYKGKPHLIDKYSQAPNLIVGENAWIDAEGTGRLSIKDDCDLFMEDHAWFDMSGESRLSLDGYSRFHMSSGSAYSKGDPCSNNIIADAHRFAFQSVFEQKDNTPIESGIIVAPMTFGVGSQYDPVTKHYRSEAEVPSISQAHKYVPQSEYMSTFKTDLDNSIVFINILSNYWYNNLDTLNNQLQALLPDYSIKQYYLFSNQTALDRVLDFLEENPSYKESLTDFIERQHPYFTEEEFNSFQSFPSKPYFNYSLVKSLAPIAVKQDRSFISVITQLNSLPFFDIEWKTEGYLDIYLFSQDSSKSGLNYVLDKDMSDPKLIRYNYDYKTCYYVSSMNSYFDSKQYYCVVTPYDPTVASSGCYIRPSLAEQLEGKTKFDGYSLDERNAGTTFLFGGPDTTAIIEGYGKTNIRIGGEAQSFIGLDITSGDNSITNFKIGANDYGEVNYFLTGNDLFIEYSDQAHIEVHDNSNFILSGRKASTEKALNENNLVLGHHDELWTVPKKNSRDTSPTLQLYHGSSFSMYGVLSDTSLMKIDPEIPGQIQVDIITLANLQNSQKEENQKYVKGAQFLLDYINYPNEPHNRTEDVIIVDQDILFSIMDLYLLFSKNELGNKYLETMVRDVIEFTETPQDYTNQSEYLPSGAQTAVFTVTQARKYSDYQYNWIFYFKVQNCLSGINDTYRMNKVSNSPLCEIADNSEFRMWGNTKFMIKDTGITLKDNSVNDDYTFTVSELKGAMEGGGYTLPIASSNTLGGIKVGSGLAIDANGVLSLDIPAVGNTGF